ncbi:SdrD B-like domain-containing protein [Lysobacter arvi]|uniref:SdrD B-like domain-containing protein n=1 Tax=Lysobacter arvi TaxID=3038776 RepID=A0ABU1CA54_9GAMM|nr:SdrD B-like domain-containing protein [Lysobacter arvi]MDR0182051.1 SdrD B-like domain-containing protein [Lysobacter arvi]
MGPVRFTRRFARGQGLCTLENADDAKDARSRPRRTVRARVAIAMLAMWSPLAWAADLQLTNLSDDGSDPTPAGSVVTYSITLENTAADTASDVRSVFDLPAGSAAVNLPAFCTVDAGDATRVVCAHGNLLGTLGGGAPVAFQLQISTAGMPVSPISIAGAVGSGAAPAASVKVPAMGAPFISDTNVSNNKETQTTTLTSAGDLQLTKTANADPVVAGSLITYTLSVRNNGPSASSGFTVVDTLPSGATFVGPASGSGWTFNNANGTYTGSLAAGATATYQFTARVTAAGGTIVNSAVVNAGATPDPIIANNTDDVGATVLAGADMEITKSASPMPATGGQPITFTLNARNRGPSAAANVSFTDTMPAGFLITGGSTAAGWTCTTTADQTARTCTHAGSYAAGSNDTFTIEATVPSSGQGSSGNQTNTATITSSTADPTPANNTGSVTFTVLADGADLELAGKTKSPGVVATWSGSGDDTDSRMTSTIRVRNRGPRPATGQVEVADTLAAGEEFVSFSSSAWTCAAQSPYAPPPARQVVVCSLNAGSLPLAVANGSGNPLAPDLVLVTRARAAGDLVNNACTGGSGGSAEPLTGNGIDVDGNTANDCTGAGVRTTTQRADLRIAKQTNAAGDADNTLPLGYTGVDFTLTIANDGPSGTAGVVVNDQIPGFISGRTSATVDAPAGWTCNVGGNGSVQCRSNNTVLASGASAVLTVRVTGPLNDSAGQGATSCAGTTLSGIRCGAAGVGVDAAIAGSVGEINTTNNSASDWVRVPRMANVRTRSKTITSGAVGREGVNSVYRIDYDNQGPSSAAGVVFRDVFTLPANDAGFVMISANRTTGGSGSTACAISASPEVAVTAAAGGNSYATPGASGTVTVTCPQLATMGNGVNESLTVTIRPNNQPGGSASRRFDNVGDFTFTGASTGTDGNGEFDYNSVDTAADDEKTASLTFQANAVDLITNKVDTGFSGGVDPLGYDQTNPPGNVIAYRVTVTNQGPSVANNVRVRDTMTPIAGRTVTFLGTSLTPGGALEGTPRCTVASGSNPTVGAPLELDCQMPGVGFGTNVNGVVGVNQTSTVYLRYRYDTAPGATGDTISNVAVASSDEVDTQPGNNSEGENTSIRSRADVGVSKTMVLGADADPGVPLPASVATVSILQPFFYVIDVVNNGPGSSLSLDRSGNNPLEGTGTVVTDTLPAGVVVTGPITWRKRGVNAGGQEPNGTGQCTRAGNVVTCNLGDVTFDAAERGRARILVPARWDAVPAGGTSNNSASVRSEQVDPVPGNDNVTVPLGVTSSSLSGTVFEDRQRGGTNAGTPQVAANEPRVANVTITLTGVDAYGNPVNRTTTTDANGNYSFANLAPSDAGGYTITQTQPAGYVNGPANPPTAGGDAPSLGGTYDAGAPNSAYAAVIVGAADNAVRYHFPEVRRPSLSGFVYSDDNFDNVRNPGVDAPIAGATVELLDAATGVVVATQTTNASGFYQFTDLDPTIVYTLREPLPAGNLVNRPGAVNPGLIGGAACAAGCVAGTGIAPDAATTDRIAQIDLSSGVGGTEFNFGEAASGASISGRVWLDIDNDGIVDAGETGIANVAVTLTGTDRNGDPVNLTTTTGADGTYSFTGLVAGNYTVTEPTQPTGTLNGRTVAGIAGGTPSVPAVVPSAIGAIALGANQAATGYDFGEIQPASVSGRVYFDHDDDGSVDAGETGIAGVDLVLTGTADDGTLVNLTTTSDANGAYAFLNVRPGTYTVTEPTQPANTTNGLTTAGNIGGVAMGTATARPVVPSAIANIVLAPEQSSVENNFGEIADSPDLLVSKSATPATFTVGTDSRYVVRVRNAGNAPTAGEYEIEDRLPTGVTLSATPNGTGWTCVGAVGADRFSCTSTDVIAQGTTHAADITVPVAVSEAAAAASPVINAVIVRGGGETPAREPMQTEQDAFAATIGALPACDPSIAHNACRLETPVQRGASIAGRVFFDNNDNGVIDAADEVGIANVELVLTGTDELGNAVDVRATTDADGRYAFPNLRPGTYVVTEPTQPSGSTNGVTTAGTINGARVGTATAKTVVPSAISAIVVAAGQDSIDNDFGEVADSPDLVVSKSATPERFTVNNTATYSIRVRNIGPKATVGEYVVEDRLPTGVTLAAAPAGNGWTCTGAAGDSRLRCVGVAVIAPGATLADAITVPVRVGPDAATTSTLRNVVLVQGGGEDAQHVPTGDERAAFEGDGSRLPVCDPAITHNACRIETPVQAAASLSGTVWFDIGNDDVLLDGGDRRLQGWTVEVVDPATGTVVATTTTAADGSYRVADLVPGVQWNVRFRDPNAGVLWGFPVTGETAGGPAAACDTAGALANHHASSCRNTGNGISQLEVVLVSGENLPQQSLPVDPSGVVYDAVTRDPVPNSVVTLEPAGVCPGFDPNTALLNVAGGGYQVEGSRVSMTVGNDGFYQFLFGPAAPASCEYRLTVTPPSGYTFQSQTIAPQAGTLAPPGAAGTTYAVQPQSTPPSGAVGEATRYYLSLVSGSGTAGIIHNHIPLDPAVAPGLVISKTGDRQTVEVGDTLLYTITIRQTAGNALASVNVLDRLPPGFTYIEGTARANAAAIPEPLGKPGPLLSFQAGALRIGEQIVLNYRVRVGVGSQQGDGINRAQAHGCNIAGGCVDANSLQPRAGAIASNRAEYRVRVTGGVFTEEGCVLGKVFVDCNLNHVQDREELGVPGVRMYFEDGTWMVSDSEGKYSYCGLPPKSHTLKVDASTLPVGSRLTTSSNRNLGDADSLFIDLKNGELHRADFIEGSCSNPVLEQVKARRTQGEVRAPETETSGRPLRFDSKSPRWPQQGTDSSKQAPRIVHPRPAEPPQTHDARNTEAQP